MKAAPLRPRQVFSTRLPRHRHREFFLGWDQPGGRMRPNGCAPWITSRLFPRSLLAGASTACYANTDLDADRWRRRARNPAAANNFIPLGPLEVRFKKRNSCPVSRLI
jgi:hypothetical protein